MTETPLDVILPTLDAPDGLPAVIERLVMEIEFTESAVASGVADETLFEVEDTLEDVDALMQAGFLCRSVRTPASHRLQVAMPDPCCIRVDLESTGVHPNVVPMLVRLIYYLHQTPPEAFQRLVATLDGDERAAIEAFAGVDYAETVAELRFRQLEGSGQVRPFQLRSSVSDVDVFRPFGWPEGGYGEWARVVIGGFDSSAELDFDLEDAWLSVSMMNAFVPLGQPIRFEPGGEEFFFRDAESGRELVCDALSVEHFWLSEWLTCLVGGSRQRVKNLECVKAQM